VVLPTKYQPGYVPVSPPKPWEVYGFIPSLLNIADYLPVVPKAAAFTAEQLKIIIATGKLTNVNLIEAQLKALENQLPMKDLIFTV